MEGLTIGRTVHYVLSAIDAENIKGKRSRLGLIGNNVEEGQHIPMVIVAVHSDAGMVNGRLIIDGEDPMFWMTSRAYSETPAASTWHWIEKA